MDEATTRHNGLGLRVWVAPPPSKVTVDICFIHGLNGGRESTWAAKRLTISDHFSAYVYPKRDTTDSSTPLWPKTLLEPNLPNARLLAFGYDSSKGTLDDYAQGLLDALAALRNDDAPSRPIIFIAHSLGGLVCKRLMMLSADKDRQEHTNTGIHEYTVGIFFMGTPHTGSSFANAGSWAEKAKNSIRRLFRGKQEHQEVLSLLELDNSILYALENNLKSLYHSRLDAGRCFEIVCFYETKKFFNTRRIVSKESATFGALTPIPIQQDHINMVKFEEDNEPGFKSLLWKLKWTEMLADNLKHESLLECLQSLRFPGMEKRFEDIKDPEPGTLKWLSEHPMYDKWTGGNRGLLSIKGKPGSGKSTLLRKVVNDAVNKTKTVDEDADDEDAVDEGAVNQGAANQGADNEGAVNQGTVNQGTVNQGTVNQGTVNQGTVNQGTVNQGTVNQGTVNQGTVNQGADVEEDRVALSFFFDGQGVELQKTPLGFLRSLLYQLLRVFPVELKALVDRFEAHKNSREHWEWQLRELQDLLRSSLPDILKQKSVWLYVDALDECGQEDASDLVELFKSLLKLPPATNPDTDSAPLHICVTSRSYSVLDTDEIYSISGLENADRIYLEDENSKDISTYVHNALQVLRPRKVGRESDPADPATPAEREANPANPPAERGASPANPPAERGAIPPNPANPPAERGAVPPNPANPPAERGAVPPIPPIPANPPVEKEANPVKIEVDALESSICNEASGGFAWARFVTERAIKRRGQGMSWSMIKNEIRTNPKQLGSLYQKTLNEGIEDGSLSLRLIQWICYAQRPLSLDELRWALVIDIENPSRSWRSYDAAIIKEDERFERYIRAISCGLAEVDPFTKTVRFIHPSVKDFFINGALSNLRPISRTSAIQNAHYQMSRICIRYMAMIRPREYRKPRDLGSMASEFPLLRYAAMSWTFHESQAQAEIADGNDLLEHFNWPSESLVRFWAHARQHFENPKFKGDSWSKTCLLHVVSHYGWIKPLSAIIRRSPVHHLTLDPRDEKGWTPLAHAAAAGNLHAVEFLLANYGAAAEARNQQFLELSLENNGVAAAAPAAGKLRTVELSLKNNGTAEAHNLQAVKSLLVRNGLDDYKLRDVKILLENNGSAAANTLQAVKLVTNDGESVLLSLGNSRVAARRNLRAVQDLFASFRDDGAQDNLQAVKVLLKHKGVEADSRADDGRTPLSLAAGAGHAQVVKLLCATEGVDPESQDNHPDDGIRRTPFWYAVTSGHPDVVRVLLDVPAVDIKHRLKAERTLLSFAAEWGHLDLAKCFMDMEPGAVDKLDESRRAPISYAAGNGHVDVVRMLLPVMDRSFFLPNLPDETGRTALMWAVIGGHEAVVEVLLKDDGVEADVENLDEQSAAWFANELGFEAIIKLLEDWADRKGEEELNDGDPTIRFADGEVRQR